MYYVLCLDDNKKIVLAIQKMYDTEADAWLYATGLDRRREPVVVKVTEKL